MFLLLLICLFYTVKDTFAYPDGIGEEKNHYIMKKVFDFLAERMGQDIFKKFNKDKGCFEGAFSNASYEAILVGVAENLDDLRNKDLKKMVEEIYSQEEFLKFAARGMKVVGRFQGLNEFSREYFSNAD